MKVSGSSSKVPPGTTEKTSKASAPADNAFVEGPDTSVESQGTDTSVEDGYRSEGDTNPELDPPILSRFEEEGATTITPPDELRQLTERTAPSEADAKADPEKGAKADPEADRETAIYVPEEDSLPVVALDETTAGMRSQGHPRRPRAQTVAMVAGIALLVVAVPLILWLFLRPPHSCGGSGTAKETRGQAAPDGQRAGPKPGTPQAGDPSSPNGAPDGQRSRRVMLKLRVEPQSAPAVVTFRGKKYEGVRFQMLIPRSTEMVSLSVRAKGYLPQSLVVAPTEDSDLLMTLQKAMPPLGMPPLGMPPLGMPPLGVPPLGMPAQAMPPLAPMFGAPLAPGMARPQPPPRPPAMLKDFPD